MNIKFIIIVLGEPYSTFSEILGKYFSKNKKIKKKIVLIGNMSLLKKQLNKLNYFLPLNKINNISETEKTKINIIDVKFEHKKVFTNISKKSNVYIKNCFDKSLKIMKEFGNECALINGPISKKFFLEKKYLGIIFIEKTNSKNEVMLIYNEKMSVSPLTTHIPIKYVAENITKKRLIKNIQKIKNF